MYDDKKLPSKMRTFRFSNAMESDLAYLMELWGCTATEALTRALGNSAVLERAFAIQRPISGIHVTMPSAASNNADQTIPAADELPTATPEVAKGDPIQTKTAAQIEKPAPSTPIIKEAPASAPASAAGEGAASLPAPADGGIDGKRYQIKILVRNDPLYSKKPKAHSGETAALAEKRAADWLREQGYPGIEPKIPAGKHNMTIKI
jgi:hypothetical protein